MNGRGPAVATDSPTRPNVNLRQRIMMATDRVMAAAVVALVFGSVVCFGGAVWWFRPAGHCGDLRAGGRQARAASCSRGGCPLLKSPLLCSGLLAWRWACCSSSRCRPRLARRLSPTAHEVYSMGTLPGLARADLPSVRLDEPATVRSPATLDRAATLRWLVGAAACLGIFWAVTHFADRLGRLYLVWGSVVAAFLLNAALGLVQVVGQSDGYVRLSPAGQGPDLGPLDGRPARSSRRRPVLRRLGPPAARRATARL